MTKLPTYPGEGYDVAMSYGRPAVPARRAELLSLSSLVGRQDVGCIVCASQLSVFRHGDRLVECCSCGLGEPVADCRVTVRTGVLL